MNAPASRRADAPSGDVPRDDAACPVREALASVSGAWASGVVARLARGPARFGQLRAALVRPDGTVVSAKVLTADLRRLAEAGVVERVARGDAAVSYRLTEKGRALVPLLDALAMWATDGAAAPAHEAPGVPHGTVRAERRVPLRHATRIL